ncbi:hypothetical protein D3C87_2174810 [compost metagenome]
MLILSVVIDFGKSLLAASILPNEFNSEPFLHIGLSFSVRLFNLSSESDADDLFNVLIK